MPLNWQLFDRIRAYIRKAGIYRQDLFQDQPDLNKITQGGNFIEMGRSGLLEQTNLQINRLERYKDYDMMDEVGEVNLALDLYADESSLIDSEHKHSVMVKAKSKKVKEEIEDFLYNTLLIDREIRPMMRYLCKYGDFASELVPTKNRDGIAAMPFINVYNFTRVQTKFGDLVGYYYQDPNTMVPQFLHPWQVMHLRLTNYEKTYFPYGKGILDGVRKDFKRLRLMEDAALIYRICVRGDTRVRTPDGWKYIKDIKVGDIVHSYSPEGKVAETKVSYQKCNGKDKIYRIFSRHREIFANATHPILVINPYKKDGKFCYDRLEYVDVKDLKTLANTNKPYVHQFVLPTSENAEYVRLKKPFVPKYARLKQLVTTERGHTALGHEIGLKRSSIDKFLDGNTWIALEKAEAIKESYGNAELEIKEGWVRSTNEDTCQEFNIPEYADEDFARWFGFMIGDGFVSQRPYKSNNVDCMISEVGIALGDDQEINEKYKKLFEKICGEVSIGCENNQRLGSYYVYSRPFVDFMLMNGFIPGCKNKRIPAWVYQSPRSVQEAFVEGYIDADGWRRTGRSENDRLEYHEVECCNEMLINDLKELCHYLGWDVGLIRHRKRKGGHIIDHETGRKMPDTESWSLYFVKKNNSQSERILGVEEVGEDLVYDIGVESEYHNFIANGICIHNTRAPERRIFSIPVGNIPAQQVNMYMTEIARQFKKKRFVDPGTGQVNERWSPLIQEDDFFLPKRGDGTGPEIGTLPGAQNLDQIEDILYFKKKIIAGMKIPFSRVGIGESKDSDSRSISSVSPEFAKAIQWIQREAMIGLKKVVIAHLALRGYSIEEIKSFDLNMTAASAIDELYRIETWGTRASIISDLKETELFTPEWILSHFTDMTEDEIAEMQVKNVERAEAAAKKEKEEGGNVADVMGGGLGGLGEAVDADDAKLIIEYNQMNSRKVKPEPEIYTPVEWYVNANELDGLNNGKFAVKSSIEDKLINEARQECEKILTEDSGDDDVKVIAEEVK